LPFRQDGDSADAANVAVVWGGQNNCQLQFWQVLTLARQRTLGAGHAGRIARVDFDGHAQSPSGTFENAFADVVVVPAVVQDDVQVAQGVGGRGLPEVFHQFAIELADFCSAERRLKNEEITATQIERRGDERFFHRQREMPITADPPLVAQGLLDSLAEADADVFDRVMLIDMQIAIGLDGQIDQCMPREQLEHVIEKAYAGGDVRLAGAIEIQFEPDISLFGLALDRGGTRHVSN
jgi:hypothetical protein